MKLDDMLEDESHIQNLYTHSWFLQSSHSKYKFYSTVTQFTSHICKTNDQCAFVFSTNWQMLVIMVNITNILPAMLLHIADISISLENVVP